MLLCGFIVIAKTIDFLVYGCIGKKGKKVLNDKSPILEKDR